MSLRLSAENKHLWESHVPRSAAVKLVGLPSDSLFLSSDTITPTKGDVKYPRMYLATPAKEVCAFSVLMHMNIIFFSYIKKLFCFN